MKGKGYLIITVTVSHPAASTAQRDLWGTMNNAPLG